MMAILARGENTTLPHQRITVTASGVVAGSVDLLVFQLGGDEKARADDDLIFFNSPTSREGAVQLQDDRVDIDLRLVPGSVHFLRVAVSLDESVAGSLAAIKGLGVTLADPSGTQIVANATGLSTERAAVLLEIYRRNGLWKVRNISAGWDAGLAALVTEHGVSVDEAPAEPIPTPVDTTKASAASRRSPAAVPARAASNHPSSAAVATLTAYPVKKEFTTNRSGTESHYRVPDGFEMLHLDLEHMFQVALTDTGIDPENAWWELGFDPADTINEYTARRMTFTVRPGHTRPPHGIRIVFAEDGMIRKYGYRPDLDWPESRGGFGTGPCELKSLIFDLGLAVDNAVKDGYLFDGPWLFRIIDDPDEVKCLEGFRTASWTKPQRWQVTPN